VATAMVAVTILALFRYVILKDFKLVDKSIQAIHDFVMNETNNVLFFSYFDVYAQDGNHQLVPQAGIYADFPQSAALFQQLFTKSAFSSSSSSSSSGGSSSSPASTLRPSFRLSDLFLALIQQQIQ